MEFEEEGRLHPEGAPGIIPMTLRQFLGDLAYEQQQESAAAGMAAQQEHWEVHMRTHRLLNTALCCLIVTGFLALVGLNVALWAWALDL